LNERQRARRRVSSTGLRTARQQVSALHLRAETLPCAVFARRFPIPAGGRPGSDCAALGLNERTHRCEGPHGPLRSPVWRLCR
jgi:hypothetical protein